MSRFRNYTLTVSDSGAASSAIWVGNEPNCAGWELTWKVNPAPKSFVVSTIEARDEWENGPKSLEIGPFCTMVGGKLFVPYPSFSLTCKDQDAPDDGNDSTVRIVARVVTCDGHSAASSIVTGFEGAPVSAGGDQDFSAPVQAQWFKVTTSAAGGPWVVKENQTLPFGGETTLNSWKISESDTLARNQGGLTWNDLGMRTTKINVANDHGADSSQVTLWWKFDLRRLK